jgi:hypothetical protein
MPVAIRLAEDDPDRFIGQPELRNPARRIGAVGALSGAAVFLASDDPPTSI